jgi:beta-lactamase class C
VGADRVKAVVDQAIDPMRRKYDIPGLAVGVVIDGKSYVFNYGVASKQSGKPVDRDTLFELGSVSKTFTATLVALAQNSGALSLSDDVGDVLPAVKGQPFGGVSLLNLGTHTPGGLPLQVPDDVRDTAELMRYLREWKPAYAPGTYRTYSNVGIGALGFITAKRLGQDFGVLVERRIFSKLGMTHSFIDVPAERVSDYAEGYTKTGRPIRMKGDVLSPESYGVRATVGDVLRFVQANMGLLEIDPALQRAIMDTHTGYFQAGGMTQDLIWEQFSYPVTLTTLLEGNSARMALTPTPVKVIAPPEAPREDVWINKTGSTNGFGSYVAFVPAKRIGIVILGNRNFPIDARVEVGYRVLMGVMGGGVKGGFWFGFFSLRSRS